MQAEIIAIGDEILVGQTVDTNSTFIAQMLNASGFKVLQKRVIADDADVICRALDTVSPEVKLVIMTGGLGPTKDDLTKQTLNDYFGGKLEFHPDIYENIERLFASFNRKPAPANRDQANLPSACTPLINKMGTASGMRFEKSGRHYFSLPGVPYETEHLMETQVKPWIQKNLQKGTVVHHTILTLGVPESDLAERLCDWENALPKSVRLAYLPSPGMVRLRLTSYDGSESEAREAVKTEAEKVCRILGEIVFGENAQTLEEVIGLLLKEKKATLSTAESCTGGYVAHLLTSVAGSSAYYKGGAVSYSNALKMKMLGVKQGTLKKFSAVSKEVALEMAAGAQNHFDSDFAIATTGVAGPSGGTDENPIGTVWIATASPNGLKAKRFQFGKNRARNIRKAALMALDLLRHEIQKTQKDLVGQ